MSFREMRRSRQELSKEACEEILLRNTHGVLAVSGDNGYPYTVPLSYFYEKDVIYIHCAKVGHKIDSISRCDKVSFCVVDQDHVVPEKYTTFYRSVILFGRAEIISSDDEFYDSINKLAKKYAPNDSEINRRTEIQESVQALAMIKINIEHITGKESKWLMK